MVEYLCFVSLLFQSRETRTIYLIPKEYRPFALLAFKTRLPAAVFNRALKPDTLARFNFVTRKVLFVIF